MRRRELGEWLLDWPSVSLVAFAIYAWTASPAIGWLDSPEFAAAASGLGVAHSPGHPLAVFLAHILGLLPIGDQVFRANLASALAGAAAAGALFAAARETLRAAGDTLPPLTARALAAAAALAVSFSLAAWSQSTRAEVYALEIALLAGATAALLHYDRTRITRSLYLCGFLTGLALANHHFLALLFFVPGALFAFSRAPRPSLRASLFTAGFGIAGLASFLYLPVRSLAHPLVNWGAPHTVARFLWTVSARAFAGAPGRSSDANFGEDVIEIIVALGEGLSWPVLALAVLATYVCVRVGRFTRGSLFLFAMLSLTVVGRALIGFDPETPDHHGYLLPGLLAAALLATALLGLGAAKSRHAAIVLAAAALLFVPFQLARNWNHADLSDGYASDAIAEWELARIPPRALLLLAYNQTSFRLLALREIDKARPDAVFLDRSFLTYPGERDEEKRRYPDFAALLDAPLEAGRPTPIPLLSTIAEQRPVLVELHPNLDSPTFARVVPEGAFASFEREPPTAAARDSLERADADSRARLLARLAKVAGDGGPFDQEQTRFTLLWRDTTAATFYCTIGRKEAARRALEAALELAPGDRTLLGLSAHCAP